MYKFIIINVLSYMFCSVEALWI